MKPTESDGEDSKITSPNRLVLLGERQSGVEWWESHLRSCFPEIEVQTQWVRDSFWFQYETDEFEVPQGNSVVVYAVRNVYDWLSWMRKVAEFAPSHASLEWDDFLAKPWKWDQEEIDGPSLNETCQLNFSTDQVEPCRAQTTNVSNPVYELGPDGLPFPNILKLRSEKVTHILSLPELYPDAFHPEILQASYHAHGEGDTPVVAKIMDIFEAATSPECTVQALPPPSADLPPIPTGTLQAIQSEVDWNIEAKLGYSLNDFANQP